MAEKRKEPFPFFSLSNQNHLGLGFFSSSSKPLPPPPPCVEVLFSEASLPRNFIMEPVQFEGGPTLCKGRVSTYDVFGVSNSDLVPGKYEGGLKLWEGSLDLVKTLLSEVRDGNLSLKEKRVLELGCGHGLPGIVTCHEGASAIHFQDFNAEVLRYLTIPNVKANLTKESLPQQSLLKNKAEIKTTADIRFFAGDWSEIHRLLSPKCDNECQNDPDSVSRHEHHDGAYDIILMAETVYSLSSLQSLYELIKKCLCRPHGVVYLAGKKHYFGVGGGTRQFQSMVEGDEGWRVEGHNYDRIRADGQSRDVPPRPGFKKGSVTDDSQCYTAGVMVAALMAEVADGSSNVREVWKFSFKQ